MRNDGNNDEKKISVDDSLKSLLSTISSIINKLTNPKKYGYMNEVFNSWTSRFSPPIYYQISNYPDKHLTPIRDSKNSDEKKTILWVFLMVMDL